MAMMQYVRTFWITFLQFPTDVFRSEHTIPSNKIIKFRFTAVDCSVHNAHCTRQQWHKTKCQQYIELHFHRSSNKTCVSIIILVRWIIVSVSCMHAHGGHISLNIIIIKEIRKRELITLAETFEMDKMSFEMKWRRKMKIRQPVETANIYVIIL